MEQEREVVMILYCLLYKIASYINILSNRQGLDLKLVVTFIYHDKGRQFNNYCNHKTTRLALKYVT